VDIAAGDAVTADNDDAVDAVVPPSSTKDEDAYVGAPVAFEGVRVSAFADGAAAADFGSKACVSAHSRTVPMPPTPPTLRCRAAATAAASVLLPPRCRRRAVPRRRASRRRHHR
jgi:hypothetical protein